MTEPIDKPELIAFDRIKVYGRPEDAPEPHRSRFLAAHAELERRGDDYDRDADYYNEYL